MYCTIQNEKKEMKPAIKAYSELQQAYDFFNTTLFNGDLPDMLL
ncbi:sprT domain-containing protein, partial [Salmonella enterica subsp. enterica serovar Schwarzengrund]|nr:sprT domain-containing protein [Salmonella enterica subsp. enterica serovar Schwarzengrund]